MTISESVSLGNLNLGKFYEFEIFEILQVGGGIDVNKEIATYSTCNGKSVVFPPETVTKGVLAAANCLMVEDEFVSFFFKFVVGNGNLF